MATKSKNRKRRRATPHLFQQAERALARRDFKQALKHAKVCYRQQPSDEHHRLLERASLARAEELHRFGMRDECRSVLQALLDLGVTEPSVERELPRLLVAVGLFDRSPVGRGEVGGEPDPRLLASAADHAVVRPDQAPASLPGVREGAADVRAALKALEAGDETAAIARLKDVGRTSPFADWKLFVRGLAAYYREDASETWANWDRLDRARFAARIAAPLRALADPASADRNDRHVKRGLGKIATEVLGGPILTHLYDLRDHFAAGRWKNVMGSLRKSHQTLRRLDPNLLKRIVAVLYETIIRKGSQSLIAELASVADPLPIDPHWNRARAMLSEEAENDDLEETEKHWLRYLDDLAGMECLAPAERTLAQALVWERMGRLHVEEYQAGPPPFRRLDDSVGQMQSRAFECFENCLRLAPDLLPAYEALASAQIEWHEPEQAADTYRRLLAQFPENLDALLFLAEHHVRRDEPLQSQEYALRAQRLKPANRDIIELVWAIHVGCARHYALRKEWDKGRAEFAAASKLQPSKQDAFHLLARKALFELKARNFDLGEQLVERAQSQTGERTPALLALTIESIRYDLSRTVRKSFERQWQAALKRRCRSETAGLMCMTTAAYLRIGVDYPGWSAHVRQLLAYVRRCSRVKWQPGDLRNVCDFVDAATDREEFSEEFELLEKLVRKGVRKFPEDPMLQFLAGEVEMGKGPAECNRSYARRCFQQAAKLAEESNDPKAAAVADRAKRAVSFLEDVGLDFPEHHDGFPPHCGPFAGPSPDDFDDPDDFDPLDAVPPGELLTMFIRACAAMGLDPEEVLDEAARGGPIPIRLPKRPSRSRPRKKKKKKR
ncbi:MAG TPA: hypothetical protein VMY37_11345 [Thermoguttaceae bacterium]|nr:hypothetical protein [Thermoguttaceae bacterium]